MTDRVHSLTVVLEKDLRVDDVESLIAAIKHFRGVLSVDTNISDSALHTAEMRAAFDLRTRIHRALNDELP